jgi:predicted  nucleic acid-binding Zn-ribbon protein
LPPRPRDQTVEIDAIKTPDGFVPTVKGLETIANKVYSDLAPVASLLEEIKKSTSQISKDVKDFNNTFKKLGTNMGDFLVLLAKIETKMHVMDKMVEKIVALEATNSDKETASELMSRLIDTKLQEMKSQELNLYKIQEALAKLVLKLEFVTKSIPIQFDE